MPEKSGRMMTQSFSSRSSLVYVSLPVVLGIKSIDWAWRRRNGPDEPDELAPEVVSVTRRVRMPPRRSKTSKTSG